MFKKTLAALFVAASLFAATEPASPQLGQVAQMSCMPMDAARSVLAQNPNLLNLNAAAQRSGVPLFDLSRL